MVSFIPAEKVHFPASVRPPYDSVSFRYPSEEDGYAGSVPGRTHVIKFFEGMCKMLPAVISGRKGNIRNVKSAVAQKKGGLLHTLAVDISVDGTAVFFCKKVPGGRIY